MDAEGTPCLAIALAFATPCEGYRQLFTLLAEAIGQAAPSAVTVGGEATGPSWLNLDEARTAQGYAVRVLNHLDVKARRGITLRGTKTEPVDARLIAAILQGEQGPASHVPEAEGQGLRDLTRLRADLVAQLGDVKRWIISLVARTFPAFATCVSNVCGQAPHLLLETWTLPAELAAVPTAQLAAILACLSHTPYSKGSARMIRI